VSAGGRLLVVAATRRGAAIAGRLAAALGGVEVYVTTRWLEQATAAMGTAPAGSGRGETGSRGMGADAAAAEGAAAATGTTAAGTAATGTTAAGTAAAGTAAAGTAAAVEAAGKADGVTQHRTPAVEAVTVEAVAVGAPAVEAPVAEAPVVEAPVVEAPVVEAAAEGTPAEETPAEGTPALRMSAASVSAPLALRGIDLPLGAALARLFGDASVGGLVVVLAVGATVRILAPWLRGKDADPAVVCVDDGGRFAVALLGGHRGGANALARRVADALDACAVITTASEADGLFAVDLLGADAGWRIEATPAALRHAAAAVVNGEPVYVYQDAGDTAWQTATNVPANVRIINQDTGTNLPDNEQTNDHGMDTNAPASVGTINPGMDTNAPASVGTINPGIDTNASANVGTIDPGMGAKGPANTVRTIGPGSGRAIGDTSRAADGAALLIISDRALDSDGALDGLDLAFGADETVVYHPPTLVAGLGCSRGATADDLACAVEQALAQGGLARGSLAGLATLDRRLDEPGVVEYASRLGLPVHGFTASALAAVPGVPNPSAIVEAAVGTPSVCEPAALLASGATTLLVPKMKTPRATAAIARIPQPGPTATGTPPAPSQRAAP
jgi:cobalamin biosynthesis protein CbiG